MSFVGQSTNKGTGKGMKQKEQLQVVKDFQNGDYNVLVSTSIGEEGLDIGEIDLIFCFDSQGSPVRMLQRMGRTGRKRKGEIILLLCKGI
jgi:ERCC4-related helicase